MRDYSAWIDTETVSSRSACVRIVPLLAPTLGGVVMAGGIASYLSEHCSKCRCEEILGTSTFQHDATNMPDTHSSPSSPIKIASKLSRHEVSLSRAVDPQVNRGLATQLVNSLLRHIPKHPLHSTRLNRRLNRIPTSPNRCSIMQFIDYHILNSPPRHARVVLERLGWVDIYSPEFGAKPRC